MTKKVQGFFVGSEPYMDFSRSLCYFHHSLIILPSCDSFPMSNTTMQRLKKVISDDAEGLEKEKK